MPTHHCQRCGGALQPAAAPGLFVCMHCHMEFTMAAAEKNTDAMTHLFDEANQKHIRNLRRVLYDAVSAKYVNRETVSDACDALRQYLPDDFAAHFYKIAVGNDLGALKNAIIDVNPDKLLAGDGIGVSKDGKDDVGLLIDFLVNILSEGEECLLALNDLVERAYKRRNLSLYNAYATKVSQFAELVQDGVYQTSLPRDVFVAYASKDMPYVMELVDTLEAEGISCFVAMRNLKHGYGAEADYIRALSDAMDNCRAVVFVSSMNSRNFSCDALKRELDYIKRQDLAASPAQYRQNYAILPAEYKKPRVEYRLEESPRRNAADQVVDHFFHGCERVYTPDGVLERLLGILYGVDLDWEKPDPMPEPNAEELMVIGMQYYNQQKYNEAMPYLRQAADLGLPAAQYMLGLNYDNGHGVVQSDTEAVKWYRKAAEQGYAAAQCNLGVCYANGQGVPRNHTEATKWYRKAAEMGFAQAQANYGSLCELGLGVAKNITEAVKWYRLAAEQGNEDAQKRLRELDNAQKPKQSAQELYDLYWKYYNQKDYATAIPYVRQAAEMGLAGAQRSYGYAYEMGQGVSKNDTEAAKWYRKAAEQGDAQAQYNLALRYKNGQGVTQSYDEAVKWFRKAAEQGHAGAQCNYGYAYEMGQGVSKNDTEAAKWYRKAAEQGYAKAQNNLGLCYRNGRGVAKNDTEAVKWFRKAAEQGHAGAQNSLADCYYNGYGVAKDISESLKWYRLSANQGNAIGQSNVGHCYHYGHGVQKDINEAVKWYRLAAAQGDEFSKKRLQEIENTQKPKQSAKELYDLYWKYYNQKDYATAIPYVRQAAEMGLAGAQRSYGYAYEMGQGVSKNDTEAAKWYRKAAEQGDDVAQNNLGLCYRNGRGVAKNDTEAVKWFRKAAEQGDAGAQNNLGLCYLNGYGVPKDVYEALRLFRLSADQGIAAGQSNVGHCYHYGHGVQKDINEAVKWYRLAAAQGNEFSKKRLRELGYN